jgi:hypothetical protein
MLKPTDYSPYVGGAGVIERLMRRQCCCLLTEVQALALWQEVKAVMLQKGWGSSADEVEASIRGALDTFPRADVLDALALVLTGKRWPLNSAMNGTTRAFIDLLGAAMNQRSYEAAPA